MFKLIKPAILLTLLLTVLCGLAYPLAMTGVAKALFPDQARGSLIVRNGHVVGSRLIGQNFDAPWYFHPRPSATTAPDPKNPAQQVPAPYNAASSNASNAAPTAKGLIQDVGARIAALLLANPRANRPIPVDLVTASGSGLDPDISPAAAEFQVPRVAAARGVSANEIRKLVFAATRARTFGLFGEARVNVLELNLELDDHYPMATKK